MTPIEHMRQCLVRQLIRWRVERNVAAIDAMRKMKGYESLKAEAEQQWNMGNRGATGDWFGMDGRASKKINASPVQSTKI